MQVSNDWPMDEPFGGPGLPDCTIDICEHSVDFYECEICFKNSPIQNQKIQKQKTKIETFEIQQSCSAWFHNNVRVYEQKKHKNQDQVLLYQVAYEARTDIHQPI